MPIAVYLSGFIEGLQLTADSLHVVILYGNKLEYTQLKVGLTVRYCSICTGMKSSKDSPVDLMQYHVQEV